MKHFHFPDSPLRLLGALALGGILAVAAGPARAADSTWTNTTSALFTNVASWDNGVPGTPDTATFDALATYTVTFDQTWTNTYGLLTNAGQTVTWDLAGNTYVFTPTGTDPGLLIGTNAGDAVTLIVNNGTLAFPLTSVPRVTVGAGGTLILTNGASMVTTNGGANLYRVNLGGQGNIIVTGAGSYWRAYDSAAGDYLTVSDGAQAYFRNGPGFENVTVDNAALTNHMAIGYSSGALVEIINGGKITQTDQLWIPSWNGFRIGSTGSGQSTVTVGRASDSATSYLEAQWLQLDSLSGDNTDVDLRVNSNGVFRILHPSVAEKGFGAARYNNAATYGRSDFWVSDGSSLTLNDGIVEFTHSNQVDLANIKKIVNPGIADNPGLLRGTGQINKNGSGANFVIRNEGWIRPGDISDTAAIGTLTINGGDLIQTNLLADNAGLHFEFSETAIDQLILNGGNALITAGSNVFTLAAGAPALSPGAKYGLGTYDFLIAETITWNPQYDNITNLLASYGLVQNLDYSFGIVDLGGVQALRLQFIPEPSTVLLLIGGGLVLWRLRRRQA